MDLREMSLFLFQVCKFAEIILAGSLVTIRLIVLGLPGIGVP